MNYYVNYNWKELFGIGKRFSIKCNGKEQLNEVASDIISYDGIYNVRWSKTKPKKATILDYSQWKDGSFYKNQWSAKKY